MTPTNAADTFARLLTIDQQVTAADAETRRERGQAHAHCTWGPTGTEALKAERDELSERLLAGGFDPYLSLEVGRLVQPDERDALVASLS